MLLKITAPIWVKLNQGKLNNKRGAMPAYFQTELKRIFTSSLVSGDVYAVRRGKGYELKFSSSIPENYRQRCRNVWRGYGAIAQAPGDRRKG
ncbi:DUF3634 family protein [Motilimonas eburnea]|uniref:DUF3634 family protein n=1 Tax=Motilimonas eburnea TaxID=1737488 RepID=UPI001E5DFC4D|nr:DUF3634 family protein [Motilimonas eburnea]MCE2570459.1 DUF3634 family protein [Motilimonas eburnea]